MSLCSIVGESGEACIPEKGHGPEFFAFVADFVVFLLVFGEGCGSSLKTLGDILGLLENPIQ